MKWICFSHYGYVPGYKLTRDLGAMCLGLQSIGEDASFWMVDSGREAVDAHIQVVRMEDAQNPDWWKQTGADVALMMSGGRLLEAYYRAIKAAGVKLVLRMDTDGWLSPVLSFQRFAEGKAIYEIDRAAQARPVPGSILKGYLGGYAYTALRWLGRHRFDPEIISRMDMADHLLVESPVAMERVRSFLERYRRADVSCKLVHLPAAVLVGPLPDRLPEKQPLVLSVGVWWRYQKDVALMVESICYFLRRHPEYRAAIIGPGEGIVNTWVKHYGQDVQCRFEIHGKMPQEQVQAFYAQARIHFLASRSEGFPNVCSEAACWGCSNVGWSGIGAFQFFEAKQWGVTAAHRNMNKLSNALEHEQAAWKRVDRKPREIALRARSIFNTDSVALRLRSLLN
jgi:glycosyltransferase involved in cell wall biosynthesis